MKKIGIKLGRNFQSKQYLYFLNVFKNITQKEALTQAKNKFGIDLSPLFSYT